MTRGDEPCGHAHRSQRAAAKCARANARGEETREHDDNSSEIHALRAENARLRQELDAVLNPWNVVEIRKIGEHQILVGRRSASRTESVKVDVPPEGTSVHFAGCMIGMYVRRGGNDLIMSSIGNRTGRGRVLSITFESASARWLVAPLDRDPIPFPTFHAGEVLND